MADFPALDFFNKVIDVQFGSGYLLIFVEGQTPDFALPSFAVETDFPSIEGGTPGFIMTYSDPEDGSPGTLVANGGPGMRRIPFAAFNGTILASDIGKTIVTSAGKSLRGFGYIVPGTINDFAAVYWFIEINSLPGGSIKISVDNEGESTTYNTQLFSYKQGIVKPGAIVGNFLILSATDTVTCPPGNITNTQFNTSTLRFTH